MFKSIQIKIFLIIIMLAIAMFAINGYFVINKIGDIQGLSEEVVEIQVKEIKTVMLLVIASFAIISSVILLFASKLIISPISKLIRNAKKIAEGEEVEVKYKGDEKTRTEIDELVKAFELVTNRAKR